jgi:hypothetical protein
VRIGYTCIFEDGTEGRASASGEPPSFQFGNDAPIVLDATLINVHGRLVNEDYIVVGRGAKPPIEDHGIVLTRGDSVVTVLPKTHGPNSIYLEPDGTPSWVPVMENVVRYADGRPDVPAQDYRHPQAPSNALEVWRGERVVIHQELDGWKLAESGLAPDGHTRILIKSPDGVVQIVWDTPESYTSTPAQFALTPIGPIVAINHPNDGMSYFRYPSFFRPWAPYEPPVVTPPPVPQPEPEPVPEPEPKPEPPPEPPTPPPAKVPWWRKALEVILQIINSQRGRP